MDNQIEKLINNAGGSKRYQIILLIIAFFVWQSLSLHNTSLVMLERVPTINYLDNKSNYTGKLTYDYCKSSNYTIVENYGFSLVIELGISCNEKDVGLIGSFNFAGFFVGTFLFSVLNKYITHRTIVIIGISVYVLIMFSLTFIVKIYYVLFSLLILGICNVLGLYSVMNILGDSISSNKRSIFTSILNMGYSLCPITYTYLYVIFNSWKIIFYIQNVIAIVVLISFIFLVNNSPRMYLTKNQIDEGVETLKK